MFNQLEHGLLGLLGLNHPQAPQAKSQQPVAQNVYTAAQKGKMIPVGQKIPQDFMNSYSPQTRGLAEIYNQNPMDARVAHVDPAMFGYAPDNSASARPSLRVLPASNGLQQPNSWEDETGGGSIQGYNQNDMSPGIQGGMVNQGFIPLQGSRGKAAQPMQNAGTLNDILSRFKF